MRSFTFFLGVINRDIVDGAILRCGDAGLEKQLIRLEKQLIMLEKQLIRLEKLSSEAGDMSNVPPSKNRNCPGFSVQPF